MVKANAMNVPVYSDFLQSTGGDGFDPQCDLLLGQSERLAQQSTLSLRTLSAFQRVLLVIDGTVTKFLEAYALEPIEIVRISQISRPLPADHDWLQAPKGTTVFARQVLLRGRYTATVYAYASSLIVRDRLQEVVQQDLEVDGKGLGHILRASRLETYREVVWYDWEDLDDLPDAFRQLTKDAFLSRTYRVIGGGQPLMLIHEKFPSSITGE